MRKSIILVTPDIKLSSFTTKQNGVCMCEASMDYKHKEYKYFIKYSVSPTDDNTKAYIEINSIEQMQ